MEMAPVPTEKDAGREGRMKYMVTQNGGGDHDTATEMPSAQEAEAAQIASPVAAEVAA